MLSADTLGRIDAALGEELTELRRMLEVLERESAQLAGGLDDGVEKLAAEKAGLSDRLAGLGARRDVLLGECRLRLDMQELPAQSAAFRTWQQLRDAAREAKARNEANGQLIGAHRNHLHARLALLGATAATSTYGPGGTANLATPRRALGAA
jgi:flagella synthesis protein FlgN